ncbi:hypothetical protein V1522DRAFT_394901 [Lipomyces starkeyi]
MLMICVLDLSLISMLPSLPPGDWNEDLISLNTVSGRPHFARVTKAQVPDITHLWHSLQIDYFELQMGRKIRSNVYEAKSLDSIRQSSPKQLRTNRLKMFKSGPSFSAT